MEDSTMRCLSVLCCLFVLSAFSTVQGQEEYEDLLEVDGEVSDQSELLDRITELREHPIDLNTASAEELQRIPWLTPVQAQKIVEYREKVGDYHSVSQLLDVPNINEVLLDKMAPFVRIKAAPRFPPLSGRFRWRVIHGGSDDEIEGSEFLFREKVYLRSEIRISDQVTIGMLTEKDADERSLHDHVVSSVSIDRWYVFDRILVGNYRLDFGQGLVLGEYSGAFKGASFPSSLKKRERGLRSYTSTYEADPFFGLACAGSVIGLPVSIFISKADVDAAFNDDGTVSSIYESGLHRTEKERQKKKSLEERVWGVHVSSGLKNLGSVGATFYHSSYNHAFDPKDVERKHYTFRGETNSVGGFHFDLYYRRLNLYGEIAKTEGAGFGLLVGTVFDFNKIEVDALMRKYARNFYNLHNYAFAEKPDETQNESGALLGVVYKPNGRIRMRAYFDRLKNPWRKYYEKMPPSRGEFWSQIDGQVSRSLSSTLRVRVKTTKVNRKIDRSESRNTDRDQINARQQIDWWFYKKGRARVRFERIWVRYPELSKRETGWLLFGDLRFVHQKWLTLENRLISFQADSYDTRIYECENDLPGLVTNLGFYGNGWRCYILAKSQLGRAARISLKYSITHFNEGNKADDHRFGIQFEFNPNL